MRLSLFPSLSVVTCLLFATPVYAASLQTFVYDVSGQSGFGTYTVPVPVMNFFGPIGVSLPANGLPVGGLSGTERLQTAAAGTLTDTAAASGNGNSVFGLWNASGSSSASARFGAVGAEGSGTRNGIGDQNTIVGFEAFGLFQETYSITSPAVANGSAGTVVFHMTIDGDISVTGTSGAAGVDVRYRQDNGPIYSLMIANIQSGAGTNTFPTSGAGIGGFSFTPTTVSGSGAFATMSLNQTFGTAFDMTFAMLAWSAPRGGAASADFSSTALLTGIDVFDAQGNGVADFSIVSGSGTIYTANGVQQSMVPLPAPIVLLASAFALLTWRRRGRRHVR